MRSNAQEYIFFLSYARDDTSAGSYLKGFFEDLDEEVRGLMGLRKEDRVGFRDTEGIGLGKDWRPELLEALQNSQTLVCIFTPLYFFREWCGKELDFFRLRQTLIQNRKTEHSFVIPVCWIPLATTLPSAVANLTFYQEDLPQSYPQDGLLVYKRSLSNYEHEYWQCVRALAQKIELGARQQVRLPRLPSPPTVTDLRNAFEDESMATLGTVANSPVELEGPSAVQFYYAAGTRKELEEQRKQKCEYYNHRGGEFWRPLSGKRIGILTSGLATQRELMPYNLPLNEDFRRNLKSASKSNTLVVLIVDVWTIHLLSQYRTRIKEYDESCSTHCTVFVVWNEGDEETEANLQHLQDRVKVSFPNSATREPIYFRGHVSNERELETLLSETLERLRMKILELERVRRTLDQFDYFEKPVLLASRENAR